MIVKFSNIKYDTDAQEVKLPTELVFDDFDDTEEYDFDEEGADYISDFVGYLVESFEYEVLDGYCENCGCDTPHSIVDNNTRMVCDCCGNGK